MLKDRVIRIKKTAIKFILGVSKEFHPNEFTGQLRMENGTITEVLVIPASTFGEGFATTRWDMIPIDKTIAGSVHSHPGNNFKPSKTDLRYFKKRGDVHLITRHPFTEQDIAAYDRDGKMLELEIVD